MTQRRRTHAHFSTSEMPGGVAMSLHDKMTCCFGRSRWVRFPSISFESVLFWSVDKQLVVRLRSAHISIAFALTRPAHASFSPLVIHQIIRPFQMTPFHRVTSMRSLIILLALPSALGYTTPAPISKPTVMPTTRLTSTPDASHQPQRYDLGLGKNKPLTNDKPATSQSQDVMAASQFWIAPVPAVTFPSPRALDEEMVERAFAVSTRPRKELSKESRRSSISLHPKRQSEDDLRISNEGIISRSRATKLDLNTVWVEMLIHNQQMQLTRAQ